MNLPVRSTEREEVLSASARSAVVARVVEHVIGNDEVASASLASGSINN